MKKIKIHRIKKTWKNIGGKNMKIVKRDATNIAIMRYNICNKYLFVKSLILSKLNFSNISLFIFFIDIFLFLIIIILLYRIILYDLKCKKNMITVIFFIK